MRLRCEALEARDCPAALFNPAVWDADHQHPIPGWDGPVRQGLVHFDDNISLDNVYLADQGGAARLVVRSGGSGVFDTPYYPPGSQFPALKEGGEGDVLLDVFIDSAGANFKFARDFEVLESGGRKVLDMVYTDAGAGPVLFQFDLATRELHEQLVFPETFRGGVQIEQVPAADGGGLYDRVAFLPAGPGGGPNLKLVDVEGRETLSVFVGPPTDTRGREFVPATIGVGLSQYGRPGHQGAVIATPDGASDVVDLVTGEIVSHVAADDPARAWELPVAAPIVVG